MKVFLPIFLAFLLLFPACVQADIQTITHKVKQPFGGSQSPDDARIAAVAKAKREALEMAGTYIESLTVVKDSTVAKDEILALAAGVLKAEVISQENYHTKDSFGIEVVVKVLVDTSLLESRVQKLLRDRSYLDQLNQARKREKQLLDRVARLEDENRRLGVKKESPETLKKQFREVSRELSAVDWYRQASAQWQITVSSAHGLSYRSQITEGGRKAVEYLSTAIKLKPDYGEAYALRGDIYSATGRDAQAAGDYKKVIQLEKPKDAFGYLRRSSAYAGLNNFQKAIQDNDAAIRLQPDNPFMYLKRGLLYVGMKQYALAVQSFDEAIRRAPDNVIAYHSRGLAFARLGQHQKAIRDYGEAIRLKPDSADLYSIRGGSYSSLRIYDRAIEDYSKAISLQEDYSYYLSRGNAYGITKQPERAIRDFDQVILLKPDSAEAYFLRGLEYMGLKRYQHSLMDFDQAIRLKPDHAGSHSQRGYALFFLGDTRESCRSFIRACQLGKCSGYNAMKDKLRCN